MRKDSIQVRADLRVDVLIVGGGLAGLSCALGLQNSGLKVLLLEESSLLGGRARSWIEPRSGDVIDVGPHAIHSRQINLLALLQQLGTDGRIVWQADRLAFPIDRACPRMSGSPVSSPSASNLGAPDLGASDQRASGQGGPAAISRSLFESILSHPSGLSRLADASHFSLHDRFSSQALRWLAMRLDEEGFRQLDGLYAIDLLRRYRVDPGAIRGRWTSICLTLLNAPPERCSAGALMRAYAELVGYRDCRMGFADCGLGELYVSPALQSLMRAGARVQLNAKAIALIHQSGIARGVVLQDGTRICATHCVMAVPPLALSWLLPARCRARPSFMDTPALEPDPRISVYLWLDRKVSDRRFWVRRGEDALSCQFYDLSNIRRDWGGRPSVIACHIISSQRTERQSDDEILSVALRELTACAPSARNAKVRHAVIHRIPMAFPCSAPGMECRRPDARTAVPGLFLAGDWTRTGLPASMESAVRSGWLAAEQVWSAVGRPRELALPLPRPNALAGLLQRCTGYARPWKRIPAAPELVA